MATTKVKKLIIKVPVTKGGVSCPKCNARYDGIAYKYIEAIVECSICDCEFKVTLAFS